MDFLRFCVANPKPCPVLEVRSGSAESLAAAPGSDLPSYRVHRNGELVDELTDVRDVWREDLVAFLIGCCFTFERALLAARLPVRRIGGGRQRPGVPDRGRVPPAGVEGPLVVSMRPMIPPDAIRATEITSRFTTASS